MGKLKDFCCCLCLKKLFQRRISPEEAVSNGKASGRLSRESRKRINHPPPPQYSALSEHIRRNAPAALQCALFCGGANCKYEQPHHWDPTQCAIQGIYSNWITDDILAMARPSTAGIAARNIVQQFHSWGVRTLINLQRAGEHASCGPALTRSGFTYDPDLFMNNDIYYYNFAWKDYGEASLSSLLDMVKVIAFSLTEGRVAIHCHAGLGRTGVLIACYLVYSLRVRANDAVRLVRRRRPRAVQTTRQILAVQQFEHYLLPQTLVFSSKEPQLLSKDRKVAEFTLRQHLHRQRATLHGMEERVFRELPKIVYCLCERLLRLCDCHESLGVDYRVRNRAFTRTFLVHKLTRTLCQIHQPSNENSPEDTSRVPPALEWRDPVDDEIEKNLEVVSRLGSRGGSQSATHIYDAFVADHSKLPEERRRYIKEFRCDLNQKNNAFERINEEEDPYVLSSLLLVWMEGLRTPVLDGAALAAMAAHPHRLHDCLRVLPLESGVLLEYLVRWCARLRPLCVARRRQLLQRLLGALAQRGAPVCGRRLPPGAAPLRDGTAARCAELLQRLLLAVQADLAAPSADPDLVCKALKPPKP